jgi:ATP-dependent DNA ligase
MSKTLADAIFEAELHPKKDAKHAALTGLGTDDLRLVTEALNPYRVFNVTANKTVMPTAYAATDAPYTPFFALLDCLFMRSLTGNAAKAAVTHCLGMYTERTAKALLRVLDKDLKCGATASTFKKLYTLDIPAWDLMGAEKMITPKEAALKKLKAYVWEFPCIAESKYDGNRSIIVVEGGTVGYFSRNGLVQEAYLGVFDAEALAFAKLTGGDVIIDGEILSDAGFQATQKTKGAGADKSALKFYAFDHMTLDQWKAQSCPVPQDNRSATLEAALKQLAFPRMLKSKFAIIANMDEAFAFYNAILEEGKNADGTLNGLGEGLIIKRMKGFYEWSMSGTRSDTWTKWKPVMDFDLKIIGFELGKAGSKNFDKLGALVCEGKDENGTKILTNVGGLKVNDKRMQEFLVDLGAKNGVDFFNAKATNFVKNKDQWLRKYIWEHKDEFLETVWQIEAQEMTRAENSENFSLRFPQLVMPRPDKA